MGKLKEEIVLGNETVGSFLACTMALITTMRRMMVSSTHSETMTNDISIICSWAMEYLNSSYGAQVEVSIIILAVWLNPMYPITTFITSTAILKANCKHTNINNTIRGFGIYPPALLSLVDTTYTLLGSVIIIYGFFFALVFSISILNILYHPNI